MFFFFVCVDIPLQFSVSCLTLCYEYPSGSSDWNIERGPNQTKTALAVQIGRIHRRSWGFNLANYVWSKNWIGFDQKEFKTDYTLPVGPGFVSDYPEGRSFRVLQRGEVNTKGGKWWNTLRTCFNLSVHVESVKKKHYIDNHWVDYRPTCWTKLRRLD